MYGINGTIRSGSAAIAAVTSAICDQHVEVNPHEKTGAPSLKLSG